MKKIEKDFLNNYSLKTDSTYEDIKQKIILDHISVRKRKVALKFSIIGLICLFIILSIGFCTYTITVEAAEYTEALEFFEENKLEVEGLSRNEIKKVYKDIKTDAFSYSLTGEVIKKSIIQNIPGYEIEINHPNGLSIEDEWTYFKTLIENKKNNIKGIYYDFDSIYKNVDDWGLVFEKSVFRQYENNILIWALEFTDFHVVKFKEFKGFIIVIGITYNTFKDIPNVLNIIKINLEGEILTKTKYDCFNDNRDEIFFDAGIFTLIRYNHQSDELYFTKLDNDLKEISNKITVNTSGVNKCVKYTDGYLLTNSINSVEKYDLDGNFIEKFTYTTDDNKYYFITDLIEYNESIFLTGYCTKKGTNDRGQVSYIIDYLHENYERDPKTYQYNISTDDFNSLVKDNFTAIILKCDKETGTPEEFYSVKGAICKNISIVDSKLICQIENITSAFYSPYTSAWTIGFYTNIYKYEFVNDTLESVVKTDETGYFTR